MTLNKKNSVVVLGDSFVEWKAGSGVNMVDILQKKFPNKKFVNLGKGGVGLRTYLDIYNSFVTSKVNETMIFLYLGNDMFNWESGRSRSNYDPKGGIKNIIKRNSVLVNILFRIGKQNFSSLQSGTFEQLIIGFQKRLNVDQKIIDLRLSKIKPELIALSKADAIDPWLISRGVVWPDYYKNMLSLNLLRYRKIADEMIAELHKFSKNKKLTVFLLPNLLQVSNSHDEFFCKLWLQSKKISNGKKKESYYQIYARVTTFTNSSLRFNTCFRRPQRYLHSF